MYRDMIYGSGTLEMLCGPNNWIGEVVEQVSARVCWRRVPVSSFTKARGGYIYDVVGGGQGWTPACNVRGFEQHEDE